MQAILSKSRLPIDQSERVVLPDRMKFVQAILSEGRPSLPFVAGRKVDADYQSRSSYSDSSNGLGELLKSLERVAEAEILRLAFVLCREKIRGRGIKFLLLVRRVRFSSVSRFFHCGMMSFRDKTSALRFSCSFRKFVYDAAEQAQGL